MDGCGDLIISSSVQMCFPGQKQVTCQDEALAVLVHTGDSTNHLAVLCKYLCVCVYFFYLIFAEDALNASGKGCERIAHSCCYEHSGNFFFLILTNFALRNQ